MDNKEILKALEELKETLTKINNGTDDDNKLSAKEMYEKAKERNKKGIKERLIDSANFCCTDELDSYILITNEKTCFSASRFDSINLLLDLIQYLVGKKVLNEKAIRKIVDIGFVDNKEFKENADSFFKEIMDILIEDYENLID